LKPDHSDIRDLIYDITGIEQEDIKDSDEFKTDLKMDSIAIADLISSLEEDFDIVIEQEQALAIKTVAQLMEFISNYE